MSTQGQKCPSMYYRRCKAVSSRLSMRANVDINRGILKPIALLLQFTKCCFCNRDYVAYWALHFNLLLIITMSKWIHLWTSDCTLAFQVCKKNVICFSAFLHSYFLLEDTYLSPMSDISFNKDKLHFIVSLSFHIKPL